MTAGIIHLSEGEVFFVALLDVTGKSVEDALEFVFEKTQNIDKPWCENEEVELIEPSTVLRSTMVGDYYK